MRVVKLPPPILDPNFDPKELQNLVFGEILTTKERVGAIIDEGVFGKSFNPFTFDVALEMLLALSDFYKVLTPVVNEERRGFTAEEMQRIAKRFQLRTSHIISSELRDIISLMQEKVLEKSAAYHRQEICK